MKKSILLLALATFIMNSRLGATAVSQQSAQTIAVNFFKMKVPAAANNPALSLSLAYTQSEADGTTDFYIFNASPMKGFVIIAGDDNAIPVVAYSSESNFATTGFGMTGVSDWMKSTATRVHYIVTNNIQADAVTQNLWRSYAQGVNPQSTRSAGAVGPLCQTQWNQNPYYNSLCPPAALSSLSNSKAVTGCVATAMAQIMKYWNYPAQGTGSNTYDDNGRNPFSVNYGTLTANFTRPLNWSAMPTTVSTNNSAVDSLMFELGVAVDMDYDSTGSGAYVLTSDPRPSSNFPCSQTVYATNFYYNPNTLQGVYLSSYSDAAWITLMENEINAGRPVQYEGQDPTQGGHTWVMDGYEPNAGGDMLHMNWGWGGNSNGFYTVTNLLTQNGGFDPVQQDAALIGIEPLWPFSLTLTPSSPSICPNSAGTTLSVQGPAVATYTWTPATGLSCTTCASPLATPTASTVYTVTADSAGAVSVASVAVTVALPITTAFSFSALASCNLPEDVTFTNTTANATSYVWDFGDGSPTSTAFSPVHSYTADGNYTVALYATNACGVDSLIKSQAVQVTGGAPVVPSQDICSGQTATLTAAGSDISWYSDPQGVNQMGTGNSITTPVLDSTSTFYVGAVFSPAVVTAGPVDDAIGTTSNYTTNSLRGDYFNNTTAQTLNSVNVYATGAGGRQFVLENSAGAVLDSATKVLTNGNGVNTVNLGWTVPVGDSFLLAVNGVPNLLRNTSGVAYPYTSTDGTVTITGNNANSTTRYYFFYDWQFQQVPCSSSLNPVTVYVLGTGGGYTFTASGTGTPTVNFSPANTTATSYSWDFGDGNTSTDVSPSHAYASAGTYTVTLTVSDGSCSETVTQTINTVAFTGISDISTFTGLTVFPNPAKDQITLSVNSSSSFSGCSLSINDILGQHTSTQDVSLTSGENKFNMDISALAPGIYFISLQHGSDVVTTRFVKASE